MAKSIRAQEHVRQLRQAFRIIEQAIVGVAQQMNRQPQSGAPTGRAGRPLNLSAARRADLKLQGRYMGYVRQLKPRQKARIKAVRAKSGYTAAIRLAKQLSQK